MSDMGTGTMGIVLWMRRNKRSKRAAGDGSGISLFALFFFLLWARRLRAAFHSKDLSRLGGMSLWCVQNMQEHGLQ
jgi:hypothetical protein